MKLKALLAAGIAATGIMAFGLNTAYGQGLTTDDLVADYLACESEPPLMPFLSDTTAYCHGEVCCKGVKAREGIAASCPEWYGYTALIYEAVEESGEYEMGRFLGICEILDTGYGRSTGDGVHSKVRSDKKSRGTIEVGQCIDIFKPTYAKAKEWMELTGGKCYVQIVKGVKG